jgi:iron-sulfur cluster assembly protein
MVLAQKLQIFQETILTISPAALTAIKRLQHEANVPNHALRISASSAGCSGLQYGMSLEAEAQDDDHILSIDGLRVLLDPASLAILKGVSIDYIDSVTGSSFQINQPNAISGCGSSSQTVGQDKQTAGGSCCN